ncbi:MAG TPA: AAA family ATPase [Herpetosiphonaceae bacterium]|nr:AAA family ATPase [Herpetosiphonaceae bacterium]
MQPLVFGDWLKQRREFLGLTRPMLAEQVRCSQKTLQNIECNQQRPSRGLAGRLFKALELALDERDTFFRLARTAQGNHSPAPMPSLPPSSSYGPLSLPQPLTSLIGRDQECAALLALLASNRCVTITGPGGVGKTRLAIEAARQAQAHYPGGVWFIELGGLEEFSPIAPPIASVLRIEPTPDQPALQSLVAALKDQKALLILDTCEHLLPACVDDIAELLRTCQWLTILATSCEPLQSLYESIYPVEPFACPDPDRTPPAELAACESMRLFIDRVRLHHADWHPTSPQLVAAARICRQLDGLPLALELTAARLRAQSLEDIAAQTPAALLNHAGPQMMLAERHRTLRASLDWGYQLLSPLERQLFRHLAVFAGSWRLETLESVKDPAVPNTIRILCCLVDKSLVIRELGNDGIRYRMSNLMQSYAWDRVIAAGEETTLRDRHLHAHLALVEAATPHLIHAMGAAWYARVHNDMENMYDALEWCLTRPWETPTGPMRADIPLRIVAAMRMCTVLWRIWDYYGYTAGLEWMERILAQCGDSPPIDPGIQLWKLRAECLLAAGNLAQNQGFLVKANRYYAECLAYYQSLGNNDRIVRVGNLLGWNLYTRGRLDEAEALLTRSLALARSGQDQRGVAQALNSLSVVLCAKGEIVPARSLNSECLAVINHLDTYQWYMVVLTNLAGILLAAGEIESAALHLVQTLIHQEAHGHRRSYLLALSHLGLVRWHQQRYGEAWSTFEDVYGQSEAIHFIRGTLAGLIGIALSVGARLMHAASGNHPHWVCVVQILAHAHACAEHFDYAIETLYHEPLALIIKAARAQVSAAEFDDHWAAGKATAPEAIKTTIERMAAIREQGGSG